MVKKEKDSEKNIHINNKIFQAITVDTKVSEVVNYCEYVYALEIASGSLKKEQKKQRYEELTKLDDKIADVFKELNLKCFRCDAATTETFAQAVKLHNFDLNKVLENLNEKLGLDMSVFQAEKENKKG